MNKWANYGKWRHPELYKKYSQKMKKTNNIISDWLEKHGDPEIDKLVEQQAREIMAKYNIEYQYLDLLQDILDNGVEKKDRTGTGTISVFGRQIRHKMSDGFPLLTTKKMAFKTMVTELLWFLRGDTNIKYLVDNNCHIWDGDAYKNYERRWETEGKFLSPPVTKFTKEELINEIKNNPMVAKELGELGPIYGKQWRSWSPVAGDINKGGKDQIKELIKNLKENPDSRRLMVSAWNVGELSEMTLPPCHYGFQVYTRELSFIERLDIVGKNNGYEYPNRINVTIEDNEFWDEWLIEQKVPIRAISLMWNQRSVDTFLGLPFNIASYGLLLEIIAKEVNMVPDELIGNLGDVHLYTNHIEQVKEQLTREPMELPKLNKLPDYLCMKDNWECYEPSDFTIENYQSHPTIKAPLSN